MYKPPNPDFSIIMDVIRFTREDCSAELLQAIMNSVNHGTYRIFYGEKGVPIGYLLWAKVCRETLYSIKHFQMPLIYEYEWSEGDISLIIDLKIPLGVNSVGWSGLKKEMANHSIIAYYRKGLFKVHSRCHKKKEKLVKFLEN